MEKEKKITIKHYLNKKIKPKKSFKDNKLNKNHFPVYTLVTFNRQSNNIVLDFYFNDYGLDIDTFEDFFNKGTDEYVTNEIKVREEILINSIRYEYKENQDSMTLKGFSKRFDKYQYPIDFLLNGYVSSQVLTFLEDFITVSEYKKITKKELVKFRTTFGFYENYKVIISLVPDFNKIIPNDLKIKITAFIQYLNFENYRGNFDEAVQDFCKEDIRVINWLNGESRKDFVKFLEDSVNGKISLDYQLDPNFKDLREVTKVFYVVENKINDYAKFIDKCINEFDGG